MIVNIGTGVAPVNIAFSSPRIVGFLNVKKLQNTTFSIKLPHYTLSKIETQVFTS